MITDHDHCNWIVAAPSLVVWYIRSEETSLLLLFALPLPSISFPSYQTQLSSRWKEGLHESSSWALLAIPSFPLLLKWEEGKNKQQQDLELHESRDTGQPSWWTPPINWWALRAHCTYSEQPKRDMIVPVIPLWIRPWPNRTFVTQSFCITDIMNLS